MRLDSNDGNSGGFRPSRQVPVRELPVVARLKSVAEVTLGYEKADAMAEASRCLLCADEPACQVAGCPLGSPIADWMRLCGEGRVLEAALLARQANPLPDVCGRVCPVDRLCERACILGSAASEPVAIGEIERFLGDLLSDHAARNGHETPCRVHRRERVAVAGMGPAGLACAEALLLRGFAVTGFDRWPRMGGLLRYGIPPFKLPASILDRKEAELRNLGLEFSGGRHVGAEPTIWNLLEFGYSAVFIAMGAPPAETRTVAGAGLAGVQTATAFLGQANVPRTDRPPELQQPDEELGQDVIVIGGSDAAMNCARTALRLGARRVICVYEGAESHMQAAACEVRLAREEGVEMVFEAVPLRFHEAGGRVLSVELKRIDTAGGTATFRLPADTVVLAMSHDDARGTPAREKVSVYDPRFDLEVDLGSGRTSVAGVFACPDAASGSRTVVAAIAAGLRGARTVAAYLDGVAVG
ncbi:MAG: FAD-dependent oxidoreductase [Candidatus Sericytochromatia bacterium]|uniref:FAD-dependent oxidoreductase n=1 Tax=Candidatus Tanganyikabacteria bacterium TaxID=2961651 RepID=A0A937X1F7_9BACT|nr:FAD-dependent oxidoreductase [Candidatus Tanganyikabacteria bacterium]